MSAGGRPTSYNDDIQEQAESYLFDWKEQGDAIPSIVGLACYLGVSKSTIYLWRDIHPTFSDTFSRILTYQEKITLNGGIKGDFNSTISKLVLANHGYHDKVDQELTGKGGEPIQWNLVGVPSASSSNT